MTSAFDTHMKQPRNVGYSKENAIYYQGDGVGSILKAKNSIFASCKQKDLFLMAYAMGIKYGERKPIKGGKENNVSVEAMSEEQKWLILASQILATNDIECLADESEIYKIAEEYANSGIKLLKNKMELAGENYSYELEIELKRILGVL